MFLRVVAAAVLVCFVGAQSACSLGSSSTQSVSIIPSHPRAEVFVDGNYTGVGPQSVELAKDETHSVMAKCGDSAGVATIDRNLSETGMLDLVGGFFLLIPLIGLVSPGAWELSPTSVSVPVPDASDCEEASA